MNESQMFEQAKNSLEQGNYEQSVELLERCIEVDEEKIIYYWYLGLAYFFIGQLDEAEGIWLTPFIDGIVSSCDWELECVTIFDQTINLQVQLGNVLQGKILADFLTEISPNYFNKNLSDSLQNEIIKYLNNGKAAFFKYDYQYAEENFLKVINLNELNDEAWYNLFLVYEQINFPKKALEAIQNAINVTPKNSNYQFKLGELLEFFDNLESAIDAYLESIQLNPQDPRTYVNLGRTLCKISKYDDAEKIFRHGVELNSSSYINLLSLGRFLLERIKIEIQDKKNDYNQEKLKEIQEIYLRALAFNNGDPSIFLDLSEINKLAMRNDEQILCLGDYYFAKKEHEKAVKYYENYLEIYPEKIHIYDILVSCHQKAENHEKALDICYKMILQAPEEQKFYERIVHSHHCLGSLDKALDLISKREATYPENLYFKKLKQYILPVLYDSNEQIEFYRKNFTESLNNLINASGIMEPEKLTEQQIIDLVNLLGKHTNFFLQYQGKNDLNLQCQYGFFVNQVLRLRFPGLFSDRTIAHGLPERKMRVGYLSPSMYSHTVGKLFLGWLKYSNHELFELYSYHIGQISDNQTKLYECYSDRFRYLPVEQLIEIAQIIIQDELDILVLFDVGMNPLMTLLAGVRLAQIQCVSWGHPITTGSPCIDYFLSSDLMEPHDGEKHYSEMLVRLPNIGISYAKPILPNLPKQRKDFSISESTIVYLSCQSLHKYLPQYDYIFPRIARQVESCQFLFLESHHHKNITEQFKKRLDRAFNAFNLDSDKYCRFLPRLNGEDYLSVNLFSDIFLDTFAWSGGNTTLEALACCLPVVTCPGEFMRGRHAYAILKTLRLEETIATNEEEYIDLAIRLGKNSQLRQQLRNKIRDNHEYLFDNQQVIKALEQFYRQAIANL